MLEKKQGPASVARKCRGLGEWRERMKKKRFGNVSRERHARPAVVLAMLVLLAATAGTAEAASSDCARKCEIWAYGLKTDTSGMSSRSINDPSFNSKVFLKHFGSLFSGTRLQLNAKDKPEYSLTATFHRVRVYGENPLESHLTVVLAFNGGENGSGTGHFFWDDKNFESHFHHQRLIYWSSHAKGHDIVAHVPLIAAEVAKSNLNELLTNFERVPIKATPRQETNWCDIPPTPDGFYSIYYDLDAVTKKDIRLQIVHKVRVIVRAEKGTIRDGVAMAGDDKSKVFDLLAANIGSGDRYEIVYFPPKDEDKSDTITVYNSCEIRGVAVVPLADTKKKDKMLEIENQCGWEGTLSMKESLAAGEKESGLAALVPGMEYDLAKNWTIGLKFKRKSKSKDVTRYEIEEARLMAFKDSMDATLIKMEREGRRIESKAKETAEAKGRRLGKGECDLQLVIDGKTGAYSLEGEIDVKGIKIRGRDEMDIKVKPVDKEIDEEAGGTTGIDEEIGIEGEFPPSDPPCVPEELKGNKNLMDEVPAEFREFMEDLGGKQSYVLSWSLKRKAVRVTTY